MKSFNNHSGLRGLPCLAEGICWATGLSLTTPFTEGRLELMTKPRPLAVIRNRRLNSVAPLVPLRSVQFALRDRCSPALILTTGLRMKGGSPRTLVDTFGRPDVFC